MGEKPPRRVARLSGTEPTVLATGGGQGTVTDPAGAGPIDGGGATRLGYAPQVPLPWERPSGQVINGRYRLLRHLGTGGMGTVYQVEDRLHPERPLALKAIRGERVTDARLRLFMTEFQVMARLRHPSIARVYDFEPMHNEPDHFFTMEYVDGVDIFEHTAELGWQDVLERWIQICRALAYIHSRRVTHSDLKPSNVLVTADGRVRVLDFGLVGVRAGWIAGTPPFIAPETLSRELVDHRADLYSLGVLAYVLLCRRYPRTHSTTASPVSAPPLSALDWEAVSFRPRDRDALPGWLVTLVERLCERDPADRYPSANAVIEAVNAEGGLGFEVETAQTRESYLFSSRFVGRDDELEVVRSHVRRRLRAESDSGAAPPLLLVSGDSGVGKSRLLLEVRRELQLSQTVVVGGDAFESGDEYGPLADVLAHLVRLAEATNRLGLVQRYGPELVKLLPSLASDFGVRASSPIGNPEAEQLRLADQVCEFLIRLAGSTPLVMILNDLHWARPGTARVLAHLLRSVRVRAEAHGPVGLALLASRRPDEPNPALEDLLAQGVAGGDVHELSLLPLRPAHLTTLVSSMLGVGELPPGFMERVAGESAGNPFFLTEIMRVLVEQGAVYLEAGHWTTAGSVGELDIPPTMREVFRRRVRGLDPGARAVLELLSVMGRPTGLMVLVHASELDAPGLHGALSTLTERQMAGLHPGDEPGYGVLHHRLQESVYGALAPPHRRALHLRVGLALERVHAAALGEHLFELAHHFREANDEARALRYALAAGDRARQQYANAQAIDCFEHAWQLIASRDPRDARLRELDEKLGDAHALQGRYDQARARYAEAARRTTDRLGKARINRKTGEVHTQRDELDRALEVLWRSVELLGESRPPEGALAGAFALGNAAAHLLGCLVPSLVRPLASDDERARVAELTTTYIKLCYVYHFVDPMGSLLPNLRANRLAERLGPSEELSMSTSILGQLFGVAALDGPALRYAQRGLDLARQVGSLWHEAVARNRLAIVHYYRSRWDASLHQLEVARELTLRCGDLFELGACCTHIFACRLNQGRYRLAAEVSESMRQVLERTGQPQFLSRGTRAQLAYTRAKLGARELSNALVDLRGVAQEALVARDLMAHGVFQIWIADLHRMRGQYDLAVDVLEDTIRRRESTPLRLDYDAVAYPLLALTYLEQEREGGGPRGLARGIRRRLRIGALCRTALRLTRRRSPNYRSQALLAQAVLEWEHGSRLRAGRLFLAAQGVARRQGAHSWLADAFLQEARCRLGRADRPADRARGARCLEQARALYQACESAWELAQVRQLMADFA